MSASKCDFCNYVGTGKGLDERGCLHRRGYPDDWDRNQRVVAASGDTWIVCSHEEGNGLMVMAVDEKTCTPPTGFKVSTKMFRTVRRMTGIVIGKDDTKETFITAEPLLTSELPYFKNALKATFKEGQDDRVELEQEGATICGLVKEFLHEGSIEQTASEAEANTAAAMADYCYLWCLAHYLQIDSLMNYGKWRLLSIMDKGGMAQLRTIEAIYESFQMYSALRWFLVHLCAWGVKEELQPTKDAAQDMLRELATEFQKKCDPAQKSPLVDVRNYYVMDELEKNGEKMEAPVV